MDIDPGHKLCMYVNKHWGVFEKRKMGSVYDWFFNYYEVKAVDHKTGKLLGSYYERKNKLDNLFDWICDVLSGRKYA